MVFPSIRNRVSHAVLAYSAWLVASAALVPLVEAAPSAAIKCVQAKSKAAARRLSCLAKEQREVLQGLPANRAKCELAFDRSILLSEAAAAGACPVPGDGSLIAQRVDDAAAAVLAALQVNLATSSNEKRCVATKNLAAAKYGECLSTMLRQRLAGKKDVGGDFARCPGSLATSFAAAETKGGCLTIGDASSIALLAGPVGANLAQVSLSGTDLRGAILVGADLEGATLSGVDLANADLDAATLSSAILDQVDLGAATLAGADLVNATITGADLRDSDLSGASFAGATLQADLTRSNPGGATFAGATLAGTRAVKLAVCSAALPAPWECLVVNAISGNTLVGPGALLSAEDLSNGDFSNLELAGAVFSGDLRGATFAGANLTGASIGIGGGGTDFSGAILAGAGIGGNHAGDLFVGADLTGADLTTGLFFDGDFTDANLTGADLDGTYLVNADMAGADLTNANLSHPCVAWSDCGVWGSTSMHARQRFPRASPA